MEVLFIHVVAVTYSQWFMVTNLWYVIIIFMVLNGLFQLCMLKCYYNHRRHTWCYMYFELNYCFSDIELMCFFSFGVLLLSAEFKSGYLQVHTARTCNA